MSAQWTQLSSFPGSPRWGATGEVLTGESGREVLALFGGRHQNKGGGFHSVDASAYTYYNELWMYDFAADEWSVTMPDGEAPHTRDHHGATEMQGELYVFGGRVKELRSADAVRNDLWSYSLTTKSWTLHEPAHGTPVPSSRFMPGVSSTVWKGKNVVAVFAGENLPGSTKTTSLNDVWVFDGDRWHQLAQSVCTADGPPADLLELRGAETSDEPVNEAPSFVFLAAFGVVGIFASLLAGLRAYRGRQELMSDVYLSIDR